MSDDEITFLPPVVGPGSEPVDTSSVDESLTPSVPESGYAKCGAKTKSSGDPCKRPAGAGTDHVGAGRCKLHGGNSPSGRKNGQKLKAKKARDTYGLPIDIDPAEALLQEVHRTAGHVAWLGAIVAQLKKKELGWGVSKEKVGGDDWGETYEAKLNVYLVMYKDERKHLAAVSRDAIKAGVETKRLAIEEQRAELLITMLSGIFDELDLTPEQSLKLDELVPKALTTAAAIEIGATQ